MVSNYSYNVTIYKLYKITLDVTLYNARVHNYIEKQQEGNKSCLGLGARSCSSQLQRALPLTDISTRYCRQISLKTHSRSDAF
jgi:hypothetical protein